MESTSGWGGVDELPYLHRPNVKFLRLFDTAGLSGDWAIFDIWVEHDPLFEEPDGVEAGWCRPWELHLR
jgi:hypothetical protein